MPEIKHLLDHNIYCDNCTNKEKHIVTIYEKSKGVLLMYKHCNRCLCKVITSRAKLGNGTGRCRFCDKTGSGGIFYNSFYCRDCMLNLYEYVADYLESVVNDA